MNQGFVIWLTGLPASGKTSIAKVLSARLKERGVNVVHLESDELRKTLTPNPDYSRSERDWFYSVLASLGRLLSQQGLNVILDATANLQKYRDAMRNAVPRFAEIYVRCPLQVCTERDPKGIYASARQGTSISVPGIQEPFEEPVNPEVIIDSDRIPIEQAANEIFRHLQNTGWIS